MSYRKAMKLLEQKKNNQRQAVEPTHDEPEQETLPQRKNNNMFEAFGDDDSE